VQDFIKAVQQESDQVATELQKVLSELEPLIEQRRRLEERAKALETVIYTYESKAGNGKPRLAGGQRHFLDATYEILQREGPLYYDDIISRLQDLGLKVPGRNPGANLIAHMTRDKRFKRTGRGTYGIAA
jgi:hypothetical protein